MKTKILADFQICISVPLKKNSLWLLPLYMVVATYFYYEKVRRTMRTAIVSNFLVQIIVVLIKYNVTHNQDVV